MIVITVGGALVGLLACVAVLLPWWRKSGSGPAPSGPNMKKGGGGGGGRNWKQLSHFGAGLAVGVLSATCVGGMLGLAARRIGGGSNTAGDKLLAWLTGVGSQAVTRKGLAALQPGGAVILVLLLVGLVIVWRASGRAVRKDLGLGLLAGCTLGPTAGLAGFAAVVLVPSVNWAGGLIVGAL
jgi:hypothetical protein